MSLDARIRISLVRIRAETVFHEIHNGREVPLLTDYFLRKFPPDANSGPPAESVDGRDLIPLFASADFYSVYCFEEETALIYEIDPEQPWPATTQFADWGAFKIHLYELVAAHASDAEKNSLRELLELN